MSTGLIVVIVVVALVVVWAVAAYNRLVRLRNEAEEGFASIDVQLQRRSDLIPNLVETVKGYASHESGTLQAVTDARTASKSATGIAETAAADQMMSQALGRLLAVAEAYPDLKASQNFQELQGELSDTEDKIAAARRYYNAVVRRFNTGLQTFPTSLIAGAFGFGAREYYEVEDAADRAAPQVSFAQ